MTLYKITVTRGRRPNAYVAGVHYQHAHNAQDARNAVKRTYPPRDQRRLIFRVEAAR